MGLCHSVCFFRRKKTPKNKTMQYSKLGNPLIENETEEKHFNQDHIKMVIHQNLPKKADNKIFHSHQDPLGFKICYNHDLINNYRIFLEIDEKIYMGQSTDSWTDAVTHLMSEKINPDLSLNISVIMNPYT